MKAKNRGQRGSTLVIVIFLLFLLSVLGLSLAALTESELIISSNYLLRQRTMIEAENGLHIAVARKMVENDGRALALDLPDPEGGRASEAMRNELEIEPVRVIAERPCNFCEINNSGSYNEKSFRAVVHDIESTAIRRASGAEHAAALQTLAFDVQLEPWKAGLDDATLYPEEGAP